MSRNRSIVTVTPTGCIGNRGIDRETFAQVLDSRTVDCVAVDAGSLDPGPWFLGSGEEHSPMDDIVWDLTALLEECVPRDIPVVIGTAGGSGARPHVDKTAALIRKIAERLDLHFRLARVYADVDKRYLIDRLHRSMIQPVTHDRPLSDGDVMESTTIVAMMGVEPLVAALDAGADVVLAGRAADNAVIAAFSVRNGFDPGLALHMGDILECGESAAVELRPVLRAMDHNRIPMIGEMFQDHFLLTPGHDALAVTPQSAIAHSFYERASIYQSVQSAGVLDKSKSKYEAINNRTTAVSGTKLLPATEYTVLMEGVKQTGYRSISILGVRTPRLVAKIDSVISEVLATAERHYGSLGGVRTSAHVYGRSGVLGPYEWEKSHSHELGVVVDVVADTQELARDACMDIRLRMCWSRYDGRQTTAGNAAVLFSPAVIDVGRVFEYSVYHSLPLNDPLELFPIELEQL